jgi:hypothetical protein
LWRHFDGQRRNQRRHFVFVRATASIRNARGLEERAQLELTRRTTMRACDISHDRAEIGDGEG